MCVKRFGFNWLTKLNAFFKHKNKINIYVVFLFRIVGTTKLRETNMYVISKDKDFDLAVNEVFERIKIKEIFPNHLMDTFYYTDNSTVVPKEFLLDEIPESSFKQLTMFT